jgi:hypothetical protein
VPLPFTRTARPAKSSVLVSTGRSLPVNGPTPTSPYIFERTRRSRFLAGAAARSRHARGAAVSGSEGRPSGASLRERDRLHHRGTAISNKRDTVWLEAFPRRYLNEIWRLRWPLPSQPHELFAGLANAACPIARSDNRVKILGFRTPQITAVHQSPGIAYSIGGSTDSELRMLSLRRFLGVTRSLWPETTAPGAGPGA